MEKIKKAIAIFAGGIPEGNVEIIKELKGVETSGGAPVDITLGPQPSKVFYAKVKIGGVIRKDYFFYSPTEKRVFMVFGEDELREAQNKNKELNDGRK